MIRQKMYFIYFGHRLCIGIVLGVQISFRRFFKN